MDLKRLADFINSNIIAGKIIGSKILEFKIEPIKGKKTIMRLTIITDRPFKPIITIGMLLSHSDIREIILDDPHGEYDLSKITLEVKVTKKGNIV